ncbi:hypothetical protein LUZ60_003673 [Juncus effusus]|nr:hypothetical protein LUZ60_003673 [Juncus effusus]
MAEQYIIKSHSPLISLANPHGSDEEEESTTPSAAPTIAGVDGGGGGAIITPFQGSSSSGRKPRGRPPGSKNKPKPPVIITRESQSAMRPVILEVASGTDIVSSISSFSVRRRAAVSVLSGTGAVTNVNLRHPSSPTSIMVLHGRFDILSFSGSVLQNSSSGTGGTSTVTCTNSGFTILVSGPQGQVIGGSVSGPLMASGMVVLVAAVFADPEVYRLPVPVENEDTDVATEKEVMDVKPLSETAPPPQQQPLYGGPVGLAGHQQMVRPEMVLWSQPQSSRPPHY